MVDRPVVGAVGWGQTSDAAPAELNEALEELAARLAGFP